MRKGTKVDYSNYYSRVQLMQEANISLMTYYKYLRKGIIEAPRLKLYGRATAYTAKERDEALLDIAKWRNERKEMRLKKDEMMRELKERGRQEREQMLQERQQLLHEYKKQIQEYADKNRDAYIVMLRNEGFRQIEIAYVLDMSQSTICKILNNSLYK